MIIYSMAENNNSVLCHPYSETRTVLPMCVCVKFYIFKYSYVSIDMFLFELMSVFGDHEEKEEKPSITTTMTTTRTTST